MSKPGIRTLNFDNLMNDISIMDSPDYNKGDLISEEYKNMTAIHCGVSTKPILRQYTVKLFNIMNDCHYDSDNLTTEQKTECGIFWSGMKIRLRNAYNEYLRTKKNNVSLFAEKSDYHQARYVSMTFHNLKYSENVSPDITHPKAMPVVVPKEDVFKPLICRLEQNTPATKIREGIIGGYESFPFGSYSIDKRVDLCKQVLGKEHCYKFFKALAKNEHVQHVELGNNVVGNEGAMEIAVFMTDPNKKCKITTWYLAGNEFYSSGINILAEAFKKDKDCDNLWLKRNPLVKKNWTGDNSYVGFKNLCNMLSINTNIRVLDLVNTGIEDDGCKYLFEALKNNHTLDTLYLDANNISMYGVKYICDYINSGNTTLKRLSLSINRLRCIGAGMLCKALKDRNYPIETLILGSNRIEVKGLQSIIDFASSSKTLKCLDIGYYKSTADLQELPNCFEGEKNIISNFIRLNTPLEYLGVNQCLLNTESLDNIYEALKSNTNLCYIAIVQYSTSPRKYLNITEKNLREKYPNQDYKDVARKIKHGKSITVIDSVYRNKL